MDKLLKLLDTNARLTNAQLAVMLDRTEDEVAAQIAALERSGVIRAYKALIDWDRTEREYVTAIIELKVTPKRDLGFEAVAETIMRFEEVESVYLMSGCLLYTSHAFVRNNRCLRACRVDGAARKMVPGFHGDRDVPGSLFIEGGHRQTTADKVA